MLRSRLGRPLVYALIGPALSRSAAAGSGPISRLPRGLLRRPPRAPRRGRRASSRNDEHRSPHAPPSGLHRRRIARQCAAGAPLVDRGGKQRTPARIQKPQVDTLLLSPRTGVLSSRKCSSSADLAAARWLMLRDFEGSRASRSSVRLCLARMQWNVEPDLAQMTAHERELRIR